ncbi:MAG: peptidase M23 [Rhodobacterales bacterium]|nr:MAG: peptidase M23 [Rhodobacterales bacterium]
MTFTPAHALRATLMGSTLLLLTACDEPLDLDLRGNFGNALNTAPAARGATEKRPRPDDRGIISYPNYQVAVARRGDTLETVANRIGADPDALARYNGIQKQDVLRRGEIVALPKRVAEPSPATGSPTTGPIVDPEKVDISRLAGGAIDRAGKQKVETTPLAPAAKIKPKAPKIATGVEPTRHKVTRGETAYTVARLYGVSVRSLADWNGLGSDFAIREGQYLLIPVVKPAPAGTGTSPAPQETEAPGVGTPTPTPPSATKPLPAEKTRPIAEARKQTPNAQVKTPDLGKTQTARTASKARLGYPVTGKIIREYKKGKNDGIDIAATPGTAIKAANSGTVAAITSDTDQVPIIVVKHPDNLLTVYANVGAINVKKGDSVKRGQQLASTRKSGSSHVHFEVRKGFDSVDPIPYLN